MNIITKKTLLGTTGVAAAALMVGGFAAPAMADTSHSEDTTSSWTTTTTSIFESLDLLGDISNSSPIVVAPEVGDISTGDVNAPIGNGSGNGNSAGNGSGNGNSSSVDDVVDNVSNVDDVLDNVTDLDVDGLVDDITGDLDLGDVLN